MSMPNYPISFKATFISFGPNGCRSLQVQCALCTGQLVTNDAMLHRTECIPVSFDVFSIQCTFFSARSRAERGIAKASFPSVRL